MSPFVGRCRTSLGQQVLNSVSHLLHVSSVFPPFNPQKCVSQPPCFSPELHRRSSTSINHGGNLALQLCASLHMFDRSLCLLFGSVCHRWTAYAEHFDKTRTLPDQVVFSIRTLPCLRGWPLVLHDLLSTALLDLNSFLLLPFFYGCAFPLSLIHGHFLFHSLTPPFVDIPTVIIEHSYNWWCLS